MTMDVLSLKPFSRISIALLAIVALLVAVVASAHVWALALLLLPVAAMYAALHHHVTVRRRVEASLRGAEANLREAQRLAHLGSWEWDLSRGERFWSDEIYRILGAERHDSDSQQDIFISAVHEDDRACVQAALGRALHGQTPVSIDHRVVRRDGSEHFVHSQIEVMLDTQGRPARVLAILHDITDRKQLEDRLVYQAFHDPLTGLPNRALFTNRLDHALARAGRQAQRLAVLFLDLDHFKLINDTLGHDAGDQVLISAAERIRTCLRPGDTVARLGGDEFTILLEDLSDAYEAEQIAERITEALAAPFSLSAQDMYVTTSIGIVLRTAAHRTPEDLLRDADVALYRAKDAGRARFTVYNASMGSEMVERVNLGADLRRALERGELRLEYQPQLDLLGGDIVAVEAFVRWLHPQRGSVSPAQFLPVAEESGLINAIDGWVLREACRQGKRWSDLVGYDLTISVNVSGRQLRRPELVESVARILSETCFAARNLKLEISEIAVMADTAQTADTLDALLKLGVQVVIDDFGTGYSSLTQLRRFPVDTLKLDGTLVRGLGRDADTAAIAGAVIGLAHSLGLKVIAEGVEHVEQLDYLRDLNCDYGQGNLFSAPLSADALGDWLHRISVGSYAAISAD
ncbi:MAG: EAL domain-containing protein [Chloroflexota bacterium]|nr:EAL domain-containing protein [Chloroflexota bacterium]